MKEVIFEDLIKEDINKEQVDEFFKDPINKQYQKDFKVYEKSGAQGGLFDIIQKNKYTKLYKDKNEVFKKVDRTLKNTIVKYSDVTNEIELAFFEEGFLTPKVDLANCSDESDMITSAMSHDNAYWQERSTGRNFKLNKETEMIEKINDNATLAQLIKSVRLGDVRAKKNFYDYALNYNWEYFCTFTFKDESIRKDRNAIKQQWRYFLMELQKINKDVKVLSVVEEHEKGGFHLHALIADIDLLLKPARNSNSKSKDYGKFLYTVFNNQIFNCQEWDRGFNTVVCIEPQARQKKIVNYLTKYITKEPATLFGEKRFYRTRNFDVRNTDIYYCTPGLIEKLVKENGMSLIKEDEYNKIKYYEIKVNRRIGENIAKKLIEDIEHS